MYGLKRGRQWLCAPEGEGPAGQIIPPVLTLEDDTDAAWVAASLDDALERRTLLQMAFGISTEVRAIR
jgi:hypothetical protein